MELISAALEFNCKFFTDHDISILCCTNKIFNKQLEYTLEKRLYANECKKRGSRYVKLNKLDDKYINYLSIGDMIKINKNYCKITEVCSFYYICRYLHKLYEYDMHLNLVDKYYVLIPPRTDIIL